MKQINIKNCGGCPFCRKGDDNMKTMLKEYDKVIKYGNSPEDKTGVM